MRDGMAKRHRQRPGGDPFLRPWCLIDGKLYLLPYEVDARDDVGIKASALSIDDLRGELLELAKLGRVLVLLDACHAGATTMDGAPMAMNSTDLRTGWPRPTSRS